MDMLLRLLSCDLDVLDGGKYAATAFKSPALRQATI